MDNTIQSSVELLLSTLRAIRDVRDYKAEHGNYPTNIEDGICFDDWAADMADVAIREYTLHNGVAADAAPL